MIRFLLPLLVVPCFVNAVEEIVELEVPNLKSPICQRINNNKACFYSFLNKKVNPYYKISEEGMLKDFHRVDTLELFKIDRSQYFVKGLQSLKDSFLNEKESRVEALKLKKTFKECRTTSAFDDITIDEDFDRFLEEGNQQHYQRRFIEAFNVFHLSKVLSVLKEGQKGAFIQEIDYSLSKFPLLKGAVDGVPLFDSLIKSYFGTKRDSDIISHLTYMPFDKTRRRNFRLEVKDYKNDGLLSPSKIRLKRTIKIYQNHEKRKGSLVSHVENFVKDPKNKEVVIDALKSISKNFYESIRDSYSSICRLSKCEQFVLLLAGFKINNVKMKMMKSETPSFNTSSCLCLKKVSLENKELSSLTEALATMSLGSTVAKATVGKNKIVEKVLETVDAPIKFTTLGFAFRDFFSLNWKGQCSK